MTAEEKSNNYVLALKCYINPEETEPEPYNYFRYSGLQVARCNIVMHSNIWQR